MPIKATPRFTAWSYSRLHDYEDCNAKAAYKHLQKLPDPGSPAMARGSEIHKTAEKWSTGQLTGKIPDDLKLFKEEFVELRKMKRHLATEQQLAVNAKWEPCDWFGRDAWLRVVLDSCFMDDDSRVHVIDFKTGKVRPEHTDQLDLYAIVKFAYEPAAVGVDASLWFLDAGELVAKSYAREDVDDLKAKWTKRTKKMLSDMKFEPNPGNACRWCPYSASKGGPCKF